MSQLPDFLPLPVETRDFHGFVQYDFPFDDTTATIVMPAAPCPEGAWFWRGRWFGHEPQTDIALLKRGYYLAYIDTARYYGSPDAVRVWNDYYGFLRAHLPLAEKVGFIGMSQGGLPVLNWAKANPGKTACIYLDAAVCTLASWPAGLGNGDGSPDDYARVKVAYGFATDDDVRNYHGQAYDGLESLAAAKVPILAVCGADDTTVPFAENSAVLIDRYRALGGNIRLILKQGNDHHPHSLRDPEIMVDFFEQHIRGRNRHIVIRDGIPAAIRHFRQDAHGTVAFLGGSITEMNGYSRLTEGALRELFPHCDFNFINAGISSTCSDTGAFRLRRDVLSKAVPDLLFVEFAVNDNQDGHFTAAHCIRGVEGIVRSMLAANPEAGIVLLFSANESHLAHYHRNARDLSPENDGGAYNNTRGEAVTPHEIQAHAAVAEAYGLPTINFAFDVEERMRHREFDWDQFGGVHPAPFGAAIYAEDIRCFLQGQCNWPEAEKAASRLDRPPLDRDSFVDGDLIPAARLELSGNSGWSIGVPKWEEIPGEKRDRFTAVECLHAETSGAEVTIQFRGCCCGLYLTAGADAGSVGFRFDEDENWQEADLFREYSTALHYPYTRMLAEELAPGVHRLHLRVVSRRNPKSCGHAVRIMALAVRGEKQG